MNSRFTIVVEMPIIAPNGTQQDGVDLRAFITDQTVGDIAVALGVAAEAPRDQGGSRVGYVRLLPSVPVNDDAVRAIKAQSAEIHYEYDRELATRLTGRQEVDDRNVVMIGTGAIGSLVADCLAREGRFRWIIIDDDHLLPHNIARHICRGHDVTKEKAVLVAKAVSETLDSATPLARSIGANVMTEDVPREEIDQALRQADIVIDATGRREPGQLRCPGHSAFVPGAWR